MKALLINVMENKTEVVEANELKDYYRLIGCTTIDIVNRSIKGKDTRLFVTMKAHLKLIHEYQP